MKNLYDFTHQHNLHHSIFYNVKSGDLLTYLAILLAFYTYKYMVEKDYKSIQVSVESGLRTIKTSLEKIDGMSDWLEGKYPKGAFRDKKSFSPSVLWKPIPFNSLNILAKNDIDEIKMVSSDLANKISTLVKKIELYNSIVGVETSLIIKNPQEARQLSEKLKTKIDDDNVSFEQLETYVSSLSSTERELAKNLFDLRKQRHEDLIGTEYDPEGLHTLYSTIQKEAGHLIKNQSKSLPWFLRLDRPVLVIASLIIFLLIELCFR